MKKEGIIVEEKFFWKRLTKKKAFFKWLAIIIVDIILFFKLNNLHNFEIVPLTWTLAVVWFSVFMYGIYTISAPSNYERCKKYLEEQGFEIDTPYVFLYKKYLIKWGKEGAYVYQKNGIVKWVIYDIIFNNEEVIDFLNNIPKKGKIFYAIPYIPDY